MALARFPGCSATLNVMMAAVLKAAKGLIRDFGEIEHLQISKKGLGDFVSTADKRSEKIIIEELIKARPGYSFLAEESGAAKGEDPHHTWIIDPLDGTTNFLHSIPHFAITVALKKDMEIIAGVTYDPVKDEMFWAEKGKGAFMNQRRLRVSGRRQMDEALIATCAPYDRVGESRAFKKNLEKIIPITAGTRQLGAAALDLAYVAAGRFDAFFENHLKPWDLATGILLVKEAGGYVAEIGGNKGILETGNVLASNTELFQPLQKLFNP